MWEALPLYEECADIEAKLKESGKINFDQIFHEAMGFYAIKCFLVADYAGDKAIFIRDVEMYKKMRFESARRKVAKMLYQRFVAVDGEVLRTFPKASSVFDIIKEKENDFVADDVPSTQQSRSKAGGEVLSMLTIGNTNNAIGVYGPSVRDVKKKVEAKRAPANLFDEVAKDVMTDLKLDVFPRFIGSDFYKKYIRCKAIEKADIQVKDFSTFRVLGRGGFGAVHACHKIDCGQLYAMKCVNKKLVKVKSALDNILEERNVLVMMDSNFVTNLKYALQDEDTLYLIMDLMLGGDLKFHLINTGRFTESRARFYAAEVLLGLEHLHSKSVIYRDMKLENILLDHGGHCRVSDLGLAVVTQVPIKGYAGTPGYTAPEMIKNRLYGPGADIFSYGVMLYRMLCGSKPFKGRIDRELDKAVVDKKPSFPAPAFNDEAVDLLMGLLHKRPENRLGCSRNGNGTEDIKDHRFFRSIDWGLLEAGYIDPPFTPNKFDVNAASLKDIGDFDTSTFRHVKLDDYFKAQVKDFKFTSKRALHDELTKVLEKVDEHTNFEKFAQPAIAEESGSNGKVCCTIV
jgi:serine/threonine protein kinase